MTHFDGHNGQVDFDGTTVHIGRAGALAVMDGQKATSIPLADITDVHIHEPSLVKGFIHFATASDPSAPSTLASPKQAHTVLITKKEFAAATALRDEILAAIGKA